MFVFIDKSVVLIDKNVTVFWLHFSFNIPESYVQVDPALVLLPRNENWAVFVILVVLTVSAFNYLEELANLDYVSVYIELEEVSINFHPFWRF